MSPWAVFASCGRRRMAAQKYLIPTGQHIWAANTAAAGQLSNFAPFFKKAVRSGGPMYIKLAPNARTNLYSGALNFH